MRERKLVSLQPHTQRAAVCAFQGDLCWNFEEAVHAMRAHDKLCSPHGFAKLLPNFHEQIVCNNS